VISPARALAAAAVILGCASCASSPRPVAFETDGCSHFPDGTPTQRELWKDCCYTHDKTYWRGGTSNDRRVADRELRVCIDEVQNPVLALVMYRGVRAGGSPWWPTRYRWAYGWPYGRGYWPLSEAEQRAADEVLDAAESSRLSVTGGTSTEPERADPGR
jgi:hypothetical protein